MKKIIFYILSILIVSIMINKPANTMGNTLVHSAISNEMVETISKIIITGFTLHYSEKMIFFPFRIIRKIAKYTFKIPASIIRGKFRKMLKNIKHVFSNSLIILTIIVIAAELYYLLDGTNESTGTLFASISKNFLSNFLEKPSEFIPLITSLGNNYLKTFTLALKNFQKLIAIFPSIISETLGNGHTPKNDPFFITIAENIQNKYTKTIKKNIKGLPELKNKAKEKNIEKQIMYYYLASILLYDLQQ